MRAKTYSLTEVAAMVLPPEWKHPERWLTVRLRRGEIPGRKVGDTWRMTEQDVENMLIRYLNTNRASKSGASA